MLVYQFRHFPRIAAPGSGPEMVRRYTASYRAEDATRRHARFSPADQMLGASAFGEPAPR